MSSPKVIFKCKFQLALQSPDRYLKYNSKTASNQINGMFNYFSNIQKRAINMFDYYEGRINKKEKVNLILENGNCATEEEIIKRKKQYLKYFEKSNLWLGIISFNNDYIDQSIELKELEKKIAKEVMPKFLKYCGFKDINNMSYQIALHTNTKHYHFHISFIEKKPNYFSSNGKVNYRRKGVITTEERNYMKSEIIHMIERHKEFTPLVIKTNKEIDELKKYFSPKERNFVLKNVDDLILEENILKLGEMIYKKRNNLDRKIKFNSIKDKEIKKLTKNIKNYLFKNENSLLYNQSKEFDKSIDKLNEYFKRINKNNNIKEKVNDTYVKNKKEYLDNYIYNSLINFSLYKYKKTLDTIKSEDVIQEAVMKLYKKKKNNSRTNILLNYLANNSNKLKFPSKYKIEQSIKNINIEMEEAINEFSKLFQSENDYSR